MAAIRRPRKRDITGQTLFNSPAQGPTVIAEPKKATAPARKPAKSDDEKNDGESDVATPDIAEPAPRAVQSPAACGEHGRFMPVYIAKMAGQALSLESPDRLAELAAAGHYAIHAYVAKSLHVVAVAGCAWDMPDSLSVRFTYDEGPQAPARECFLLTLTLYDTIIDKCAEAEVAFLAGGMEDLAYRTMCYRMRGEHGVDAMARKYATARDFMSKE